jgi:phage terminase small subunit
MPKITPKQQRFVDEYLIDLNATQAAIRAGYSPKTARQIGQQNLSKLVIQAEITEGRKRASERTEITVDRILQQLAAIAFLDVRRLFDAEGNLLSVQALADDVASAIASLESEDLFEGRGPDRKKVGRITKIKLADKMAALQMLGKYLGMFVERTEISGAEGAPIWVAFEGALDKVYGDGPMPQIGPQTKVYAGFDPNDV